MLTVQGVLQGGDIRDLPTPSEVGICVSRICSTFFRGLEINSFSRDNVVCLSYRLLVSFFN